MVDRLNSTWSSPLSFSRKFSSEAVLLSDTLVELLSATLMYRLFSLLTKPGP